MLRSITEWLKHPFKEQENKELLDALNVTFSTLYGQRILQHWLDSVYCTVYVGTDPIELAYHNGRRSVIQEVLVSLDQARDPVKYSIKIDQESDDGRSAPFTASH